MSHDGEIEDPLDEAGIVKPKRDRKGRFEREARATPTDRRSGSRAIPACQPRADVSSTRLPTRR